MPGCGSIAVPVAPPRPNQSLAALERIAVDSGAAAALRPGISSMSSGPRIDARSPLAGLTWIASDGPYLPDGGRPARDVDPGSLAYLQYTSGSTSEPKGVVIGHDNLIANLRSIVERATGPAGGVTVGWLPLHHDMGLVSTALQSLYLGGRLVLMPPLHFLQKPIRWLRAISVHRAATSGGTELRLRALCPRGAAGPARRTGPPLLDGRLLLGGADPGGDARPFRPDFRRRSVSAARRFILATAWPRRRCSSRASIAAPLPVVCRYDPAALRRRAGRALPDDEPRGKRLVGCGRPGMGTPWSIVDPESRRPCPPERIGEVWVAGPGIGRGYWGRPELSAESFGARTFDGDGPFLRTGDLGFKGGGQLFITGRLKELIIIRGHNYYPHDIERTARAANPALRPDGGAAFSVDIGGEERLILVHEVERTVRSNLDLPGIVGDVREAVAAELGVRVHALVLIRPTSLPRTTSGKVRRGDCRQRLLLGKLDVLAADYGIPDCRGEN